MLIIVYNYYINFESILMSKFKMKKYSCTHKKPTHMYSSLWKNKTLLTFLRWTRCHNILISNSMWTCGERKMSGRFIRSPPEWHHESVLDNTGSLARLSCLKEWCNQQPVIHLYCDMSGTTKLTNAIK